MGKLRVYELSKELGISNKKVISVATDLNIDVRSHVSTLSDSDVDKIKEQLKGSLDKGSSMEKQQEQTEQKEEVKVFTSESGQEVIERRKGDNVVIRRRKGRGRGREEVKQQEEQPSGETEELQKADEIRQVTPDTETPQEGTAQETEEDGAADNQSAERPQQLTAETDDTPIQVGYKSEDKDPEVRKKKAKGKKREDIAAEETDKDVPKTVKKVKKAKPKKDEFIDAETLENLRQAFRTKLPSRKKEYVVHDKRPKMKTDAGRRGKPFGKTGHQDGRRFQAGSYTEQSEQSMTPATQPQAKRVVKIGEAVTVGEIAKKMQIKAGDVIKKLLQMGFKATINESLDEETATLVADEFGFEVNVEKFEEDKILLETDDEKEAEMVPRPPVVTVMGHVDHGKTTLLDTIRKANVVGGEAGGITQHIGAYKVFLEDRVIVFIDTPGHEAFTSMRARGASITDIVILVVAADDGVMPQTVEAVNHAKAAGVPIIVAINKIDKPEADLEKVKRQLSEVSLIPEDWGGDTLFAEVSAKSGKGIPQLLELVLLQSDVMELKAADKKRANGVVIEAQLDKGRGPVSTVLVTEGTLNIGDFLVAGQNYGKVRALTDDKGKRVKSAGPSMPVEIMGLSGVPEAGERFYVVKNEKAAKEIVSHREDLQRSKTKKPETRITLEGLYESIDSREVKELNLIVKADTQGSVEAIKESLVEMSNEKCRVNIVHTGVGAISETDVTLAAASDAIVVGFNVRPDKNAKQMAENEGVTFELHNIIYNVVSRIKDAMEGLLEPIIQENVTGHAEVRETFRVSKQGTIAGCMVIDGKVIRDGKVRVIRDGVVIYDGKIASLKRFKDDAKEVNAGYECGISVHNYNDIKVGDVFELYELQEIKQEL